MYRAPLALLVAATLSGAATYVGCSSEPELRLAEPQRQIADAKPRDCEDDKIERPLAAVRQPHPADQLLLAN